ncbi:hypothetical protein D3C86_1639860 [compost metagenome]
MYTNATLGSFFSVVAAVEAGAEEAGAALDSVVELFVEQALKITNRTAVMDSMIFLKGFYPSLFMDNPHFSTALKIPSYPVHLQMFPHSAFSASALVGAGFVSHNAVKVITMPAVQ